jgi:hypothetical protein
MTTERTERNTKITVQYRVSHTGGDSTNIKNRNTNSRRRKNRENYGSTANDRDVSRISGTISAVRTYLVTRSWKKTSDHSRLR